MISVRVSVCARPRLHDSLSPQAYGETTTHALSDMQCEVQCAVCVCVVACADVNKIGLVERLNGLVLVCAQG